VDLFLEDMRLKRVVRKALGKSAISRERWQSSWCNPLLSCASVSARSQVVSASVFFSTFHSPAVRMLPAEPIYRQIHVDTGQIITLGQPLPAEGAAGLRLRGGRVGLLLRGHDDRRLS
jgi:hypothetical protein